MLLLVDNGSSYTDKLDSLLSDIGCSLVRLEPHKVDLDSLSEYTSFVLSGRQANDKNMNKVNSKIIKHAIDHHVPLLGICYGAEIIALSCGGSIQKMKDPRQGLHTVNPIQKNDICSTQISVFESHRYKISTLPDTLVSVASSEECINEIIHVTDTTVYGTQFHPEMSEDGHKIVAGFARQHPRVAQP